MKFSIKKFYTAFSIGLITSVYLSADIVNAFSPVIALDDTGNAVAIWQGITDMSNLVIRGATMPSGGSWSAPTTVSGTLPDNNLSFSQTSHSLAVNSGGDAVAVWSTFNGLSYDIAASRIEALGSWETPPV